MDEKEMKINFGREAEPEATDSDLGREDADAKKLTAELEEMKQSLLRHQADFVNYRKRMEKESAETTKRATGRVIESLIPVVDSFEQALAAHREAEYENYRKGFELIHKQLLENLVRLGAERVDPAGKPFDPHLHQAVDRVETPDHEDGEILETFQPGYLFHGRVLRPALVRVAVHPGGASKGMMN